MLRSNHASEAFRLTVSPWPHDDGVWNVDFLQTLWQPYLVREGGLFKCVFNSSHKKQAIYRTSRSSHFRPKNEAESYRRSFSNTVEWWFHCSKKQVLQQQERKKLYHTSRPANGGRFWTMFFLFSTNICTRIFYTGKHGFKKEKER